MCAPKAPSVPLNQLPTDNLQNRLDKLEAKEAKWTANHPSQRSPVVLPGSSAPVTNPNPFSAKVDNLQGILDKRSAADATAKELAAQQANFPMQMQQQQTDFYNQMNTLSQQSQSQLTDLQRQLQEQQQAQLSQLKLNTVSAQVGPNAGMRAPTAEFGGQVGRRGGVRARARGASLRIGSGTSAPGVGTNLGV